MTCVIADGIMSFANDFAREIRIPVIYFRTISACGFWANFWIPELVEPGELPFKGALSVKLLKLDSVIWIGSSFNEVQYWLNFCQDYKYN